jgi:hypothetical protein
MRKDTGFAIVLFSFVCAILFPALAFPEFSPLRQWANEYDLPIFWGTCVIFALIGFRVYCKGEDDIDY